MIDFDPKCNCYEHTVNGSSWVCPIHGKQFINSIGQRYDGNFDKRPEKKNQKKLNGFDANKCEHIWKEIKFYREWNDSWNCSLVCSKCGVEK